jgi:hypothetical protein
MAQTQTPFGLLARWHPSGQARSNAYYNVLLSGMTTPLYYGTPVKLAYTTGGGTNQGVTVAANQVIVEPVAAQADLCIGSFAGVEYTDSTGVQKYSKFWTGGTTTYPGTQTIVYLWDDPEIVYEIQLDGPLDTGSNVYQFYGRQLNFNSSDVSATAPAGNAVPVGQSACRASATLVGTGSTGQLVIVSSFGPQNSTTQINDPFPTQYVKINKHQFRNPAPSILTGY